MPVHGPARAHAGPGGGSSPADALDRFLRLLGVPGDAIPADVDDRAALYRDKLRGRGVLVVLDNAHSARQLLPLLPAEPRCRVLVTSRNRLAALDDAHQVAVEVLPEPDSVELLRSLLGDRAGEGDESVLRSVAARGGHLPLAVRIAAARVLASPSWRLADLDRRLGDEADRMRELDDGERDVDAVFRLSLDAGSDDQRAVFGLLALHPGADLDLAAAAALAGRSMPDTERLLGLLRDGHLVVQEPSGRYRYHDLLRHFAVTRTAAELPSAENGRRRSPGCWRASCTRRRRPTGCSAPNRYRRGRARSRGPPEPGADLRRPRRRARLVLGGVAEPRLRCAELARAARAPHLLLAARVLAAQLLLPGQAVGPVDRHAADRAGGPRGGRG